MQIQWYPGHMTKARRTMEADLKLVDLVIELTDARAPQSGRNPDIDRMTAGKARMIVLNKADLADDAATQRWIADFGRQGIAPFAMDARQKEFQKSLMQAVMTACSGKLERDKRRGIQNRPIRAMVAGIPNVGKSTFINSFAGRASAKTGNRPGVTKGNQWIRVDKRLELLDTPGILWPKFEDETVGRHLALIGSVNDEILNLEELAFSFLQFMNQSYPENVRGRYGLSEATDPLRQLKEIAAKRGCLKQGGEPDYARTARLIIEDFRSKRLGRITLELPEDKGDYGDASQNKTGIGGSARAGS